MPPIPRADPRAGTTATYASEDTRGGHVFSTIFVVLSAASLCRVVRVVQVGNGPHSVVFGEIVYMHLRDDLYDARTDRIDVAAPRPVGRLAGHMYSRTHDLFEMKRPNPDYKG